MYESLEEKLFSVILIMLFLAPVLIISIRKNVFRKFSFSSLIKVLNSAFIIQLFIGVAFFIVSLLIKKYGGSYEYGHGNRSRDLFSGAFMAYSIIMLFYTPALIILNISKLFIGKLRDSRRKSTNTH